MPRPKPTAEALKARKERERKAYYRKHRERLIASQVARNQKDKATYNANAKAWRRRHPEKQTALKRRYRHAKHCLVCRTWKMLSRRLPKVCPLKR